MAEYGEIAAERLPNGHVEALGGGQRLFQRTAGCPQADSPDSQQDKGTLPAAQAVGGTSQNGSDNGGCTLYGSQKGEIAGKFFGPKAVGDNGFRDDQSAGSRPTL